MFKQAKVIAKILFCVTTKILQNTRLTTVTAPITIILYYTKNILEIIVFGN